MAKFEDKETSTLLDSFLKQAFASAVRDKAGFDKITNRQAGMRMSHGVTFFVDQPMNEAEHAVVSKIVAKLGPQLGHYSEIANIIWGVAAEHLSKGGGPDDTSVKAACFEKLEAAANRSAQFIHPSYNVALSEGVKEIRIGPVVVRDGFRTAATLSKKTDKIEFGFEEPTGFVAGKHVRYNVSEAMWDIEVSSSAAARHEHASWLTCIATTLIRLVVNPGLRGVMSPGYADVENKPFDRHKLYDEHIITQEKGSFSLGGGKAGRVYDLGKSAKRALSDSQAKEKISLVFDPPGKSLALRFSQGLGWLAKGRQASDRSDRFLFFFTALEALLSSDDKTSPVVQTIARHAAVLWSNDIKERLELSKKLRKLYATRSALVHAGSRSVTYEFVTEIHKIAEAIFYAVWCTADLKINHQSFCHELAEASYGLPYFEEKGSQGVR